MTVWGPAQADSTNAFRIGYDVAYSNTNTATATVTVTLRLGTKYYADDSSVSWSIGGGFSPASGTKSFDHNSGTAWSPSNVTVLGTVSRTVSTSYSSSVYGLTGASVTGLAAIAGTASVPVEYTVPKRGGALPAAPNNLQVEWQGDTQQLLGWTNVDPGSSSAPYKYVEIERWDNSSEAWSRIATVGVVSSYTDKSTRANRRYSYRVRARNDAGVSAYEGDYPEAAVNTTPAAPGAPIAKKTSSGDIYLTWQDNSPYNTGIEVWHAADGVWDLTPLVTLGAVTSWGHTTANPAQVHTYKLKAIHSLQLTAPVLKSEYSGTSAAVALLAAPLAPTPILPTVPAADATEGIELEWRHRPVDTTDQTKFEVEHRISGGSWVSSGEVVSGVSAWTLPANTYTNPNTLEWRVRTWGGFGTASPWSPTSLLTLSTRPTVLINTPTSLEAWDTSLLTLAWGYNDADANPQTAWQATLYNEAGGILESRGGSGDAATVAFTSPLVDGDSYTVGVKAQDSTGIWSAEDLVDFDVQFDVPPTPVVTVEWRPEDAASVVSVYNPPTTVGEVDAVSVSVWRATNDGPWVLLAEGLSLNTTITDFIPALNATCWYRAIAVSALPSAAVSDEVSVSTEGVRAVVVNAGAQFSQSVQLIADPKVDVATTRQRTLQRFAGRTLPVEYAGEQRSRTVSLSASLYDALDSATWEDVAALADMPAPACYRDPDGRRIFVSLGDPSVSGFGAVKRSLSWDFTEIDWTEPTEAT